MNVKSCKMCKKLFNYLSGPSICPACREMMEKKFQDVKEYVRTHKGATIHEISEDCEVEVGQIKQWVREERLEFSADSPIGVECESCGTQIKVGRFCEKCKNAMANGLAEAAGLNKKPEAPVRKETRESARMRFLDNR